MQDLLHDGFSLRNRYENQHKSCLNNFKVQSAVLTYNSTTMHVGVWLLPCEQFPHCNTKGVNIDLKSEKNAPI